MVNRIDANVYLFIKNASKGHMPSILAKENRDTTQIICLWTTQIKISIICQFKEHNRKRVAVQISILTLIFNINFK